MKKPQHGIAIEKWDWQHKSAVRRWLLDNFGDGGNGGSNCDMRWGEEFDYGLENLYMDEDVYVMYCLRWT